MKTKWNRICFNDGEKVKGIHQFRGHKLYNCPKCDAGYSYSEKTNKQGQTLYTVVMNPAGFGDFDEDE